MMKGNIEILKYLVSKGVNPKKRY